jgi:hypothetical protein
LDNVGLHEQVRLPGRGADGTERAGECVVAIDLFSVGIAWLAKGQPAVGAGSVIVSTPGDSVNERLRQQRGLGVHWRQVDGQQRGEGLLQAAYQVPRVGFQGGNHVG